MTNRLIAKIHSSTSMIRDIQTQHWHEEHYVTSTVTRTTHTTSTAIIRTTRCTIINVREN